MCLAFPRRCEADVEIRESALIRGVKHVHWDVHGDDRGRFAEVFRREWFPERTWGEVQVNLSTSRPGILRGLHYHRKQIDYWWPVSGRIRVGLCDLRRGSPTEGARECFDLDASEHRGLYIPVGVGHGYLTLTDVVLAYVVDVYFDGSDEFGVAWNDPGVGMPWNLADPVLSARDRGNPRLADVDPESLPRFA